jgi:hypothetical protein
MLGCSRVIGGSKPICPAGSIRALVGLKNRERFRGAANALAWAGREPFWEAKPTQFIQNFDNLGRHSSTNSPPRHRRLSTHYELVKQHFAGRNDCHVDAYRL